MSTNQNWPTRNLLNLMAEHNRWMNRKLYAVCGLLSDEERNRDLGAFFKSVHGTLNHLLLVDRLWLGRLWQPPLDVSSLDQILYAEFDTLSCQRDMTDVTLQDHVARIDPDMLATPIHYVSLHTQQPVTLPMGLILVHLFHHQTHHRGQVTTLLSQLGYDYKDTDMIYMPGAERAFKQRDR